MRAATIIRNPAASTVPSMSALEAAAASLTDEWRIEIWNTLVKGDAEHLAREAAEAGFDVVFACGGDGTANEVANGLAGTRATFGLIRGGLTNVLADELEIPEDLEAAVGVLRDGQVRHIDVGLANGRRFLLQAGVGFDASVVRAVSPGQSEPSASSLLCFEVSTVFSGAAASLPT